MVSENNKPNFRTEDWLKNAATCIKCKKNYEAEVNGVGKMYLYNPNSDYTERQYTYFVDISLAYEIAHKKNKIPTYSDNANDLERLVAQNEIFVEHVHHLTSNDPGVLITFKFQRENENSKEKVMVLAEGNHRAKLSIHYNVPYYFYYFDENETTEIVKKLSKEEADFILKRI